LNNIKYILLSLLIIHISLDADAQSGNKNGYSKKKANAKAQSETFLSTQWWLGFKAGANMTRAVPGTTYAVYSPINYDPSTIEKQYESYGKPSFQAAIDITFYHKGFSFGIQPGYRRQQFSYATEFEWSDVEIATNHLELRYDQSHDLDYIEIPLIVKYDFTRGIVRPFIQIGAYYSRLINAGKSVEISGADYASGAEAPFERPSVTVGVNDLFIKTHVGLIGGAGVSYDVWNVRLVLDVSYRYGLNNISHAGNRYTNNQLAGIGDALDYMKLQDISATLGLLFPLRYITKNYNAIESK
jgi:hypothetical protein